MRKKIVVLMITAMVVGALFGCASGSAQKQGAEEPTAQEESQDPAAEAPAEQESSAEVPEAQELAAEEPAVQEAAQEPAAEEPAPQESASQDSTAQAPEAETGGVRPLFQLRGRSFNEFGEDVTLATGSYEVVELTEEAAIDYPHLNKAIEAENDLFDERYEKSFGEIVEAARNEVQNLGENTEDFPSGEMTGEVVPVRCDQSVLSFYERTYLFYPGAAHGTMGYSCYNYNTANGERIALGDVFKDPAALLPVVAANLRSQSDGSPVEDAEEMLRDYFDGGMDDLTWVIDQSGVTFLFAPSDIAPYAMGTLESKLSFDRDAALFTGKHKPSGDGYVRKLSPFSETSVDLDGDGSSEQLGVTVRFEEGNEINEYSGIQVTVGDQTCTAEAYCFGISPYWVHTADGRNYVYVIAQEEDDYKELIVFEIRNNVPSEVGRMGGTGIASVFYPYFEDGEYKPDKSYSESSPMIDPTRFALGTRMALMSTYSASRYYEVGQDGMPSPLTDYYEIGVDLTLTSKVPMTAEAVDPETGEATGEEKEIPAGTKLQFWRTNGVDTVDLKSEDGEAFRFKIETEDGQTVNGIRLQEAFDGIMFAG